jgi:hypothetical protein
LTWCLLFCLASCSILLCALSSFQQHATASCGRLRTTLAADRHGHAMKLVADSGDLDMLWMLDPQAPKETVCRRTVVVILRVVHPA